MPRCYRPARCQVAGVSDHVVTVGGQYAGRVVRVPAVGTALFVPPVIAVAALEHLLDLRAIHRHHQQRVLIRHQDAQVVDGERRRSTPRRVKFRYPCDGFDSGTCVTLLGRGVDASGSSRWVCEGAVFLAQVVS